MSAPSATADIVIAGAGIIGLALALELDARGAQVVVLERDTALSHASIAAAGMLAAQDAHNPAALLPLSQFSLALYPAFLERVQSLAGIAVPFQTETTVQYAADGTAQRFAENSLDPRQLAAALLKAVRSTVIDLREHTPLLDFTEQGNHIELHLQSATLRAQQLVLANGPWSSHFKALGRNTVAPRKGQMLRVALPPALRSLREVHRSEEVYIVPRTSGPQAGSALIGATIEDAGFDVSTRPESLAHLRSLAAKLLPELADEAAAPQLEAWAGLRPCTPDELPLLGAITPRQFVAAGHFRNGILLAPATAMLLADLLQGRAPAIDLAPFSPTRFS